MSLEGESVVQSSGNIVQSHNGKYALHSSSDLNRFCGHRAGITFKSLAVIFARWDRLQIHNDPDRNKNTFIFNYFTIIHSYFIHSNYSIIITFAFSLCLICMVPVRPDTAYNVIQKHST